MLRHRLNLRNFSTRESLAVITGRREGEGRSAYAGFAACSE
jgi:hypothetical protein